MEFRTALPQKKYPFQLNHTNTILCIGSCFAETIGNFLNELKFNVTTNPLGTIFNPLAISNCINWALQPFQFDEKLVIVKDGKFTHFLFHSDIFGDSIEELNDISLKIHTELHATLLSIDTLIITLGTAYGYRHKKTDTIVSNCHKVAQQEFNKTLIDSSSIETQLLNIINQLPQLKQTILTVSPVRHIKDTIELNSVSKSMLRLATHQLSSQNKDIHYFPSYEIILDDLRDYRFFKVDMIHPTEQARSYVCNYFSDALFSKDTLTTNEKVLKIKNAINHRPFNPSSSEHQKFLKKTLENIKNIELDFTEEVNILTEQLI